MDMVSIQTKPGGCRDTVAFSQENERACITLDIRDDHCPITYVKTKLALEAMESGQILELLIKGAEPLRNVPRTVRDDGHTIISARKEGEYYRLLVRKA